MRRTRMDAAVSYRAAVLLLTLLSLWPIWQRRLVALQDYPQHLFVAHVLATADDPQFAWRSFYEIDPGLRPYVTFYAVTAALARLTSIETAGKLFLSGTVLLLAFFVGTQAGSSDRGHPPWPALLCFPLYFSQTYYLGFVNYNLSLVLLLFALRDWQRLSGGGPWARPAARLAAWLCAIVLSHPFTAFVFAGLTLAAAAFRWRDRAAAARAVLPGFLLALFLMAWLRVWPAGSSAPTWTFDWWPWRTTLAFIALPFTGMGASRLNGWMAAVAWLAAAAVAATALFRGLGRHASPPDNALFAVLAAAGTILLPFQVNQGDAVHGVYFSVRLAPLAGFLAVLALGRARVGPRGAVALTALAAVLLVPAIRIQRVLSIEAEDVVPCVLRMRTNARVLSVVFDGSTRALPAKFFFQVHRYEPYYYVMLVGGGVLSDGFTNDMIPVRRRRDVTLPAPHAPSEFDWSAHAAAYDYVLARRPPPSVVEAAAAGRAREVARSGSWVLFEIARRE